MRRDTVCDIYIACYVASPEARLTPQDTGVNAILSRVSFSVGLRKRWGVVPKKWKLSPRFKRYFFLPIHNSSCPDSNIPAASPLCVQGPSPVRALGLSSFDFFY